VILLDTNAIIWLEQRHPRARPLTKAGRLYISPASILELQFLQEAGRVRFRRGEASDIAHGAWLLDDPPAVRWFETAVDLTWTRDPFDRLIVAHARLRFAADRRDGWRFVDFVAFFVLAVFFAILLRSKF